MKKNNKKQTFKCYMYQFSYFGSSNKISNVKKKTRISKNCGGHLGATAGHHFGRGPSNDYSRQDGFYVNFP